MRADPNPYSSPKARDGVSVTGKSRRSRLLALLMILAFGIVSLVLFAALVPDPLQSRNESRVQQAYDKVRQIQVGHEEALSDATRSMNALPGIDPWGKPYRIVPIDAQRVRVVSAGPNMSFATVA